MCLALVVGPCMIMKSAFSDNSVEPQETVDRVKETETEAVETVETVSIEPQMTENPKDTVWLVALADTDDSTSNDIQYQEVSNVQQEIQAMPIMYISANRVNVYSDPTEEAEIVTTLIFTDKVEIFPENNIEGWSKIQVSGYEGYIADNLMMYRQEFLDNFQYLLAQALMSEAGGVSKEEMGKVGEVILNRVTTTYWEFNRQTTIREVLSASGQYPGTYRKIQNGLLPSEDAMEVAESLLLGEYENQLPDNCYWQTGFDPVRAGFAVEVVDKSYCGNNYYHYYAVPLNE